MGGCLGGGGAIRIIARDRQPVVNEGAKKSSLNKGEVVNCASRNKYASRYAVGSAVAVLELDVPAAFPSSGEANEALRALAGIIQKHRSRRPTSHRRS